MSRILIIFVVLALAGCATRPIRCCGVSTPDQYWAEVNGQDKIIRCVEPVTSWRGR